MTTAEERHRDGVSCLNPAGFNYDANGRGRWCADCGAPLGEEASWHPEGDDVNPKWIGLAILAGVVSVLLVLAVLLCLPANPPGRGGPTPPGRVTPSPMWHPGPEWTGVPSFGRVPDSGVRPVVG